MTFKLSAMGMVSSFLRDRSIVVEVDGVKFAPRYFSPGVSQGCSHLRCFFYVDQ
jgi:hypothetical protein